MQLFDNTTFYYLIPLVFLLGASLGSFVTMASWRLPREEEIVFKPSHCTECDTTLRLRDLVPVFSWVSSRGLCRHCNARVSIRYPLIEVSLGLVFTWLALAYGLTFQTLLLMLLATELAILIVTDLEHTIIPDGVQIALFFTGIAYGIWRDADWGNVFACSLVGLGLGLALHYGYKMIRKKDGLGWADVKFLCVAGIWLSLTSYVPFLFIAGICGTLTGLLWQATGRGPLFPFGPALAFSLFINVLFPDLLLRLF